MPFSYRTVCIRPGGSAGGPDLPELFAQPLETDARSVAIEDDEQAGDQIVSSDDVVGEDQFVG